MVPLTANLFIDIQETLDGGLVSINTLYEVINTFIGFEGISNYTHYGTP